MMKNFSLVFLLVLCTGFIVALNLSYLRKIIKNSDLQVTQVDDGPRPSIRQVGFSPKPPTNTKDESSISHAAIPVEPTPNAKFDTEGIHRVAGLNCDKYGGPSEEIASEMVYWRDIPSDAEFVSPFASYGESPKYLTFEPDEGSVLLSLLISNSTTNARRDAHFL